MQDHLQIAGALSEHRQRVVVGGSGVDHERLPGRAGQLDLGDERALLIFTGRVVAVVIEPSLTDCDAPLMRRQRLELCEVGVVEARRRVRVTPDRRVHLGEVFRRLERGAARRAVGPDREHPGHAGLECPLDELGVRRLARVQMRVAIDHCSLRKQWLKAAIAPPGEPSAARSFAVVSGMNGSA